MFTTTSLTGVGIAVFFVTQALRMLGVVEVDQNQVANVVTSAIQVISFVMMVWGQARRPDISTFFFKAPQA